MILEGYQYSFLIMSSLLMVIWAILYELRKDLRQEMLFVSLPLGLMGLVLEVPMTDDWWQPLTVSGSVLTIESVFFSIGTAGIAAVAYEVVFYRRLRGHRSTTAATEALYNHWWLAVTLIVGLFFVLHGLLGLNTFVTSIVLMLAGLAFILFHRPDLTVDALVSGLLMLAVIHIIYAVTSWLTPGWIEAFWLFQNVPPIYVLNVPIDDVVYYLVFGAAMGPLYEFAQSAKLVKVPQSSLCSRSSS